MLQQTDNNSDENCFTAHDDKASATPVSPASGDNSLPNTGKLSELLAASHLGRSYAKGALGVIALIMVLYLIPLGIFLYCELMGFNYQADTNPVGVPVTSIVFVVKDQAFSYTDKATLTMIASEKTAVGYTVTFTARNSTGDDITLSSTQFELELLTAKSNSDTVVTQKMLPDKKDTIAHAEFVTTFSLTYHWEDDSTPSKLALYDPDGKLLAKFLLKEQG